MIAAPELESPRTDPRTTREASTELRQLVAVVNDSAGAGAPARGLDAQVVRSRPRLVHSHLLQCTRVPAGAVRDLVAWSRRRAGKTGVSPMTAGAIGTGPRLDPDLPRDLRGVMSLLAREGVATPEREAIAAALVALRTADALVVGPLSPDDANTPGLFPHLADLACRAYLALRPPRELIAHTGFAQVARRFQYIQMDRQAARALGAGATDIGILAQSFLRLQGDRGEFAITAFAGCGLLRAEGRWWEIEAVGDGAVNEARAATAFCTAWVVARGFLGLPASRALAYARSAATVASRPTDS
jgi:hypothetical protein